MKAAVMEQFGEPLKFHSDWSDPECGPRDAIIKVEACGICRSDHTLKAVWVANYDCPAAARLSERWIWHRSRVAKR